jgi:hypothetical protein
MFRRGRLREVDGCERSLKRGAWMVVRGRLREVDGCDRSL